MRQLAQVNLGSFSGLRFKESRESPYPCSRIFLSLPLDQVEIHKIKHSSESSYDYFMSVSWLAFSCSVATCWGQVPIGITQKVMRKWGGPVPARQAWVGCCSVARSRCSNWLRASEKWKTEKSVRGRVQKTCGSLVLRIVSVWTSSSSSIWEVFRNAWFRTGI